MVARVSVSCSRLLLHDMTYFDDEQPEPTGLSGDTSHGENSGGQQVGEDSGQVQRRPAWRQE